MSTTIIERLLADGTTEPTDEYIRVAGLIDQNSKVRAMSGSDAGALNVSSVDPQTLINVLVSPFGELLVAEIVKLIGEGFEGSTLDAQVWTTTLANGGAATPGLHLCTLATNTTANGSAKILSTRTSRFIVGFNNRYLAGIRLGDTGIANNVRRWGAFDDNNGVFFQLNGTTPGIVRRNSGVDTVVTSFNGSSTFVIDTNFHVYQIIYSSGTARFYQDTSLIHTMTATTTAIADTMNLKIGADNINSGGSTTNASLVLRGMSIARIGSAPPRPRFFHLSALGTTVLKRGAGTLLNVNINQKGTGGNILTFYDNTAGSGTVIAAIDTSGAASVLYTFALDYDIGLTIVSAAGSTGDITISYE